MTSFPPSWKDRIFAPWATSTVRVTSPLVTVYFSSSSFWTLTPWALRTVVAKRAAAARRALSFMLIIFSVKIVICG
jgi:hypothetical protein